MVFIKELILCDSFAGIGALHKSLKRLGVPVKLGSMLEVDVDAIISYGASHDIDIKSINTPPDKEMRDFLLARNIGYDFKKGKSSIPKLNRNKLELCYKYSVVTNNYGDISKVNPDKMSDFDIFNFSFSCTDYSIAGKRQGKIDENGDLTRSGLYVYGIDIIKIKKPKYIMIENVKGLISKDTIDDFYEIINEIESNGYNCYYPQNDKGNPKCLNAKDFGIPQNRERIFVICIRKDIDTVKFEFPKEFDNGLRLKDILETNVDEKYYIDQEKCEKLLKNLKNYKELQTINELIQVGELDIKGMDCIKRVYSINGISPTITTMEGGNRQPKIIEPIICEERCDEGLRFFKNNICGTLRTIDACGDKRVIETNYRIRKLTPLECWRLMGFDDEDFYKSQLTGMSDSQLYKQAGNSIVVDVLYYIFKNLFNNYITN